MARAIFNTIKRDVPITIFNKPTTFNLYEAVVFTNAASEWVNQAHKRRFAIIWDEDHDERAVVFAEKLFLKNLLGPVEIVLEHQGGVWLQVSKEFLEAYSDSGLAKYINAIESIACVGGDTWQVDLHEISKELTKHFFLSSFPFVHKDDFCDDSDGSAAL